MKKQFIALNTTIMLGLGSIFSIPAVHAESVQSQRAGIQSSIASAQNLLTELQAQKTKLTQQVEKIKEAYKENKDKITETENQIKDTEQEINALKEDIKVLEKRIADRQEVLKQRALTFQETGGDVNYMEVLLGSTSFQDFIERVGAVTTIMQADRDILTQQETDKADLVAKKTAVETKLNKLNSMKVDLEGMQAQINDQKKQSEQTMQSLALKEKETTVLKTSLERKDANLAAQVSYVQSIQRNEQQHRVAQRDILTKAADSISSAPQVKSTNVNVSTAIHAGYRFIGNSTYVWGGGRSASDVANGYFDCSGFVSWAYRQAGVSLPASTDGLKYSGTQVSASQMQPGDLVFFNTYKTDGHVGIYIGGGKFIGSQSSTGVAIANMSSGYWAQRFNGRVVRVY